MTLFPDRSGLGIIRQIGARNPYALAERINHRLGNEPIRWDRKRPDRNRETLNDLMPCSYEQLFDPGFGLSPLYPSPVYMTLINNRPHVLPYILPVVSDIAKEAIVNPEEKISHGPVALQVVEGSQPGQTTQEGAGTVKTATSPCSNTGDHWAIWKIPSSGRDAKYCIKPSQPGKGDIVDDVVQGCTKDCYFHAALASVAWCRYPDSDFPAFINQTNATVEDTYTYTFYYPDGATKRPVTIASDVIVDTAGNMVYSRPSNSGEVWPALYEKAYGELNLLSESGLDFQGRANCEGYPRPNLPEFSGGNPLESLEHITGGSWTLDQTYFNTKKYYTQCFNLISRAITWNGQSGITTYPMVAWSYYTAAEANADHPKTPIAYDSEIIVANHSYSILGALKSGNANYIVLRNPYGRLWGADPDNTEFGTSLYKGDWTPIEGFTRTLSVGDGIFALKAGKFELYFKSFGWVV